MTFLLASLDNCIRYTFNALQTWEMYFVHFSILFNSILHSRSSKNLIFLSFGDNCSGITPCAGSFLFRIPFKIFIFLRNPTSSWVMSFLKFLFFFHRLIWTSLQWQNLKIFFIYGKTLSRFTNFLIHVKIWSSIFYRELVNLYALVEFFSSFFMFM